MKKFVLLLTAVYAILSTPFLSANQITFDEKFVLAKDRSIPLKELIPGTEKYFFYHCLYHEQKGEINKVKEYLAKWIKKYAHSTRVNEIKNRLALLGYEKNSNASLSRIIYVLGVRFNHQKRNEERNVNYPTKFDEDLISRQRLTNNAFNTYHNKNVSGFEDSAFYFLINEKLNADQRRDFLRRLRHPGFEGLPKMIIADLAHKYSRGFGAMKIHRLLTIKQLNECLKLMPKLLINRNFSNLYLSKLKPSNDINWQYNREEKGKYLARMLKFARKLPIYQNSLKANLLFQTLNFNLKDNKFDKELFIQYLKYPRNVYYINRKYMKRFKNSREYVSLNANYQTYTSYGPIRNDFNLVKIYLEHFLVNANSSKEFEDYIDSNVLKKIFAEVKILNNIGDMETWYSLINASLYKTIKERVELNFSTNNKILYNVEEKVHIKMAIKNVKKLIIKTYRINTSNYYQDFGKDITTGLDLDGLVANSSKTIFYKQTPFRRHLESFDFADLKKPGVYIIEFIGNGKSSRALIRKGLHRFTVQNGSAGHVFHVFNAANEEVKNYEILLGGHHYNSDKNGKVIIPFSARSNNTSFIIQSGEFATLHSFTQLSENYSLNAGIYVDRESLVSGKMGRVIIRPSLTMNTIEVDINILEDIQLVISSVDQNGIKSQKTVKDFKLKNEAETTYDFKVPEKLQTISFVLKGFVKSLANGKKSALYASHKVSLNNIQKSTIIEDLFLRKINGIFVAELLGKSGEGKAARAVNFIFKHKDFTRTVHSTLKTNETGLIVLGKLKDIVSITATSPEGSRHTWQPAKDSVVFSKTIHAVANSPIAIPFISEGEISADEVAALFEIRGQNYTQNVISKVQIKKGFLNITGLSAGDYQLIFKKTNQSISLKITGGKNNGDYLLSPNRYLKIGDNTPLQIISTKKNGKNLFIKMQHVSKSTRLHIIASRFVREDGNIFNYLSKSIPKLSWANNGISVSQFVSGRNIGDEYRYILERKYAHIFPGNMLSRVGILLNPWALRKTQTANQNSEKGENWNSKSKEGKSWGLSAKESVPGLSPFKKVSWGRKGRSAAFSTFDFLPSTSYILTNLKPDKDGIVEINLKEIGPRQQIHILAIDDYNSVYKQVSLDDQDEDYKDLRLKMSYDTAKHYTAQKKITTVMKGKNFTIKDITTSKLEIFDSLSRVYSLLSTLNNDTTFTEFRFILEWDSMKEDRKLELYSKYASHEMNFFIFKKDPAFFRKVIFPYIANKKDKTFMDEFLLGMDLTKFTKSWSYHRLNVVERILLAHSIKSRKTATQRHMQDLYDLLNPNTKILDMFFETALKGNAFEEKSSIHGFADAKKREYRKNSDKFTLNEIIRKKRYKSKNKSSLEESNDDEALEESLDSSDRITKASKIMSKKDRLNYRRYYQKLEKTEELVENNYYHLPIERQVASLVTVNGFWKDYAAHNTESFVSTNVAEATGNFTEMMFAMSVLDLPFKEKKHKSTFGNASMKLTAANSLIVYHKEIKPAARIDKNSPILVGQNFFAANDRYFYKGNKKFDKFISEEFEIHRVYGCQIVLTNPSSNRKKVDVLMQIPQGAIPVANGFYTDSIPIELGAYSTRTLNYAFYFPAAGQFKHFPVHVSQDETLLGFTNELTFNVVKKSTKKDKTSWDYISQNSSQDDVIEYLKRNNADRLNLKFIAFRMKDKAFYKRTINLLDSRMIYNHTLWSYSLKHNDPTAIQEYLKHSKYANLVGSFISTKILTVDPVERHHYQFREYSPLVNARIYQLGGKKNIMNHQFAKQYNQFMATLKYLPKISSKIKLDIVYYMLLMDRIEEAIATFKTININKLETKLQYDYMKAYLAFYEEKPENAKHIANKYKNHPVLRWRNRFLDVIAQANEINGAATKIIDDKSRNNQQTVLADNEPSFNFVVSDKKITINYQNLDDCKINYYPMDIELLFSRNPFVQDVSGQFSIIHPNYFEKIKLGKSGDKTLTLPKKYHDRNVMIEIVSSGKTKFQAYYPHSLNIQTMGNYGQLKVTKSGAKKGLSKVYIKVYAKMKNGQIKFFKDGYTDLRGRFDYTSLSTNELSNVVKFSILILSKDNGSMIKELAPPKM